MGLIYPPTVIAAAAAGVAAGAVAGGARDTGIRRDRLQEIARTVRAFYANGRPPVDSLRTLQRNAAAVRDDEWATVRAYLPETMRATFDGNVSRIREDEVRAEERRFPPME